MYDTTRMFPLIYIFLLCIMSGHSSTGMITMSNALMDSDFLKTNNNIEQQQQHYYIHNTRTNTSSVIHLSSSNRLDIMSYTFSFHIHTLFEEPSQLLLFHSWSVFWLVSEGRSAVWDRTWFATSPVINFSLFPGAIPCLPRKEHNHHPSRPPVSCSRTVITSPRLKASSSGDSATLSYSAFAKSLCWKIRKKKQKKLISDHKINTEQQWHLGLEARLEQLNIVSLHHARTNLVQYSNTYICKALVHLSCGLHATQWTY